MSGHDLSAWPEEYRDKDAEVLSCMALTGAFPYATEFQQMDGPVVHNVVCTCQIASVKMPLNLQALANLLPSSSYDKRTFAAITLRTDRPFSTALLFSSGKLVVTGCKSQFECIWASYSIVKMLNDVSPYKSFQTRSCTVQNMVAHGTLPVPEGGCFDIQKFYQCHSTESTYQRRMFPGLIYRSRELKVVILLFCSAKVVLTGAKTEKDIAKGWDHIMRMAPDYLTTCAPPP